MKEKKESWIKNLLGYADGHEGTMAASVITLDRFDIEFPHVDFGYESRQVLKDVSFSIPEHTKATALFPAGRNSAFPLPAPF